jgi:hypothetical protein
MPPLLLAVAMIGMSITGTIINIVITKIIAITTGFLDLIG